MNGRGRLEHFNETLAELWADRRALEEAMATVDADIKAFERAIDRQRALYGMPDDSIPVLIPEQLTGSSLMSRRRQGLRKLAENNNDILVVKEAKEPMIRVGLYKDSKQFSTQVYGLISEMGGNWIKLEAGVYRIQRNIHNNPFDGQEMFATG